MDSIISTFHIDWKVIIAQVVNFGVVFVVLYIFALKPLAQLMRERSGRIEKGIEDAKSNAAILEKTAVEYEKALAKARAEANAIFQEGKKEAESKKAAMIEEAKGQAAEIIDNGKKMLESEKIKVVEEAKKEIAGLAMLAAEKILASKQDLNNL